MALQKQTITLDFGFGGLDQRADPKLVQRVRFTQLENARFNKIGRIDRRSGNAASLTTELASIDSGGGNPASVTALAFSSTVSKLISTGENLMAIGESDPPKPYRAATGGGYIANKQYGSGYSVSAYMPVAELRSVELGSSVLFGDDGNAFSAWDRADSSSHACFVYSAGGGSAIRVEVRDKASNSLVRTLTLTGYSPQVVSHPDGRDQWIIAYTTNNPSATAVHDYTFQTFGLTTAGTTVVGMPTTTQVARCSMHMVAVSDANQDLSALVCIGWINSSITGVYLRRATWPATDGSGAALSTTSTYAASSAQMALCTSHNRADTSSHFRVLWHLNNTSTGIFTATFNRNLTTVLGPTLVHSVSTDPSRLAGCQVASGKAHVVAAYSHSTIGGSIYGFEVNTSNTPTRLWIQDCMTLQSKLMAKTGGEVPYFWMGYQPNSSDTTQPTLFLAASVTAANGHSTPTAFGPPILGRLFHTTAWQFAGERSVVPPLIYDGTSFITMSPTLSSLGLNSSRSDSRWTFNEVRFSVTSSSGWVSTANRSEALITGGLLSKFNPIDGVIANGPQLFPTISVSATTSGGSMALGSYAISGIFEYVDATGRVSRSAPALPVTFSLTGTQNGLVVFARTYPLADGLGTYGSTLRFIPYRTLVNESQVYYRAGAVTMDPTGSSNTAQLTLSDAFVAAEEPLYTVGGVYENWQPSAPIAVATNGRRVLVVPGDRPCFVMESKPIIDTESVHFMEEIGRSILPNGDRIYALASYQDRWIAFKESGIFMAQGDGADRTGNNDTLSEFQPIAVGVGCTAPRSVLTTSLGVVFQSQKGFYLIAGGTPQYIGAAVEDYTSAVRDAAYDAQNELAYFTLEDGTELVLSVFETEQGVEPRWSVDSTFSLNSSAVLGGVRYIALSTPNGGVPIYKETPGVYLDGHSSSTAIPDLKMTTAWVEPAGLQGLARIYKALFLGQFPSTHPAITVTIEVGYNYATTFAETHTISSAEFEQSGDNAQFDLHPQRQKCEAIRFRISQSIPASDYRGLWLNQIQLTVGVKSGDNKIKASARARKA